MKRLLLIFAVFNILTLSAKDYLIKTTWGQTDYTSLLPKFNDGSSVFSGCTTVAAAQVINYYGFLPEYNAMFSIDVAEVEGVNSFPEGTYVVNHEDFDTWVGHYQTQAMPTSEDQLIAAVFYSQANLISSVGTSTSPFALFGCFNNHFSYDIEAYVNKDYKNIDEAVYSTPTTQAEQKEIVKTAIANKKPAIINGTRHSFIIDGYDEEEDLFHFNYGWGEGYNRWAKFESWDNGMYSVFIVTPNKDKVPMPELKSGEGIFHIRDVATGVDHTGIMKEAWAGSTHLACKCDDGFHNKIPAGTYEIWIESPDHTVIAPALSISKKVMADLSQGMTSYKFIDHPALFTIEDPLNYGLSLQLDAFYDTKSAYIDFHYTELTPNEAILKANEKIIIGDKEYPMHEWKGTKVTDPIEFNAGEQFSWIMKFDDVNYGYNDLDRYRYDMKIPGTIMVDPVHKEQNIIAYIVTDDMILSDASACSKGGYGSNEVFYSTVPTEYYVFSGGKFDFYKGPISSLTKVTPEKVNLAFYLDKYGPHVAVSNYQPGLTTGIEETTAYDVYAPAYDLQGRRVYGNRKGLVIRNGKLVVNE